MIFGFGLEILFSLEVDELKREGGWGSKGSISSKLVSERQV